MDTILDIDVDAGDNPDPSIADSEANGNLATLGIANSEAAVDAPANGIANGQPIRLSMPQLTASPTVAM